jgi:hypothetical protein
LTALICGFRGALLNAEKATEMAFLFARIAGRVWVVADGGLALTTFTACVARFSQALPVATGQAGHNHYGHQKKQSAFHFRRFLLCSWSMGRVSR